MPKFFFDFSNGHGETVDQEGSDHSDLEAAEHEAIDTLVSIARDASPLRGAHAMEVRIRDDSGVILATCRISLTIEHPR